MNSYRSVQMNFYNLSSFQFLIIVFLDFEPHVGRHLQIVRWTNKVRADSSHLLHKVIIGRKLAKSRRITSIVDYNLHRAREYKVPQMTVLHRAFPNNPPWNFNESSVDTSLSFYKKRDTNPLEYRGMVLEKLENMQGSVLFYTDGTKQTGGTGYGVFRVSPELRLAKKLRGEASVFSAEASAILHALRLSMENSDNRVIFTDSLSVCNAVLGFDSRSSFITNIRDLLIKNPQYRIVWIPGHSGIPGNETADDLANSSISRCLLDDPRISLEDIQRESKSLWREKRRETWKSVSCENKLRDICADPFSLAHPSHLTRRERCILTRLRIGHTRETHGYLMEGSIRPPKCDECAGNKTITVKHLLEECVRFSDVRSSLGGILIDFIGDKSDENSIKKVLLFVEKSGLKTKI